jgi:dolichol-phosphate mannosyltransferase
MKTVILIPTYDEAENIPELFARISTLALPDARIVVIDDASPDHTAEVAERTSSALAVDVLRRSGLRGLGGALISGMRHALELAAETVVTMDADLSHAPEALPQLLREIANGADLAIGSRRVPGGSVQGWNAARDTVSRIAAALSRAVLGLKTHDVTSGYRAYRASFLKSLDLGAIRSRGYLFQEEMVWRAERAGLVVTEVPIHFVDRRRGASKLSLAETAFSLLTLVRLRLAVVFMVLKPYLLVAIPALLLRALLSPAKGYEYDLWAFGLWARESVTHGFLGFFSRGPEPILTFPNYALYFPILKLLGAAADPMFVTGRVLLKAPSMLMDIVLGAVIFSAARRYGTGRALIAAAFYLFNPAVWYTSAVWGQVDAFHSFFLVLAVLALTQKRFTRAWMLLTVAVFFKLQSIMFVPLIAAVHVRTLGWRAALRGVLPAAVLAAAVTAPYVIATSFGAIYHSFFSVVGKYPLVTLNVWGPWMLVEQLVGRYLFDYERIFGFISWFHVGLLAYVLAIVAVLRVLPYRPGRVMILTAAALLAFVFYLFPTEIHERYLFPLIPIVSLLIFESPLVFVVGAATSLILFLNINLVGPWHPALEALANWQGGRVWIFLNIATLIALWWWFVKQSRRDRTSNSQVSISNGIPTDSDTRA